MDELRITANQLHQTLILSETEGYNKNSNDFRYETVFPTSLS